LVLTTQKRGNMTGSDTATLNRRLDDVFHIGDGVGANRVGGTPEEDDACALAVATLGAPGLTDRRAIGRGRTAGALVDALARVLALPSARTPTRSLTDVLSGARNLR